ncbi:unnamed protein product, partial [Brugia timori]|uniref:Secreted protein n=1 Tax=Brugia timori TaxID=42155 RepID=A0A0R3QIB8_9BILA
MLLIHISLCRAQSDNGNQFCEYNPHPSKIIETAMNAHVRLLRKVDQSCHLYQGHAKLKDSGEYKEEHKDGRNHGVEVTQ